MSLETGSKLGQYEIVGPLGAGGMGEVYRARDTKLDREVAIKVLPDELAHDQERIARFEREAKLLAQLNHPNIATLHGFEDGYIVMKLSLGEPRVLFEGDFAEGQLGIPNYDVTSDGREFVMVVQDDAVAVPQINVVVNWDAELKRLLPAR